MLEFVHESLIPASVPVVFAFHQREDVLELLMPPWQPVEVLRRTGGLDLGAEVEFRIPVGPFGVRWLARHTAFEQDRLFVDEQVRGPFRSWVHRHEFHAEGSGTRLVDRVRFELPIFGRLAEIAGGWLAIRQLRRMFEYRHEVTRRECLRMMQ